MSEHRIYKLNLSAADFSYASFYRSSSWGGSDTPNASYPEFGEMENIVRNEGTGASGQNVADASNTADYTTSWITMCGVGDQSNGQYDCRGGGSGRPLKCRWKQQLRASALAESGYCVPLGMANGGAGGTAPGLFSINNFFLVEMYRTFGAAFNWSANYLRPGVSGFTTTTVTGSPGTADNAEHELIASIVPATVTGGYPGGGSSVGALIASDGSFNVTLDGVSVVSATGIKLVINQYATTNPEVYFGKSLWHGD